MSLGVKSRRCRSASSAELQQTEKETLETTFLSPPLSHCPKGRNRRKGEAIQFANTLFPQEDMFKTALGKLLKISTASSETATSFSSLAGIDLLMSLGEEDDSSTRRHR